MGNSCLESLPQHILEAMSGYLKADDVGSTWLLAFALCSKLCYSATIVHRFRRATLRSTKPDIPSGTIETWHSLPEDDKRLLCIREIIITNLEASPHSDTMEEFDIDVDRDVRDVIYDQSWDAPRTIWPQVENGELEEYWMSVAKFLTRIPVLLDLVFDVNTLFPPCLLDVLHQYHPSCRLHIPSFSLPSLAHQVLDRPHGIDPYEHSLATSQCLYSIGVEYLYYSRDGGRNFMREATMQMMSGAAPSLRHVHMYLEDLEGSLEFQAAEHSGLRLAAWDFFCDRREPSGRSRPRIETIRLQTSPASSGGMNLQDCIAAINLQYLKTLELDEYDFEVPQLLELVSNGSLYSLKNLALVVYLGTQGYTEDLEYTTFVALLHKLEPLESLRLVGGLPPSLLESIATRHGATLQRLTFLPQPEYCQGKRNRMLDLEGLRTLSKRSPHLESLAIRTPRTQGNEQEVRIYQTLSSFPRLQRISLTLDCSIVIESSNLTFGRAPFFNQAKSFFQHAAIDTSLATSIFSLIYPHQPTPMKSTQFLQLKVDATLFNINGDFAEPADIGNIINWIGREFACTRILGEGDVVVREMRNVQRERRRDGWQDDMLEMVDGEHYAKVWKEIWGGSSKEWRDVWRSLPLVKEHVIDI